jgi:acetylornithine/N-succinyldiaminopimelate aminotransferase
MARTGTFYGSEGIGLQPDIITLAKPLAGGLPLSAVLIPQKVNCLIHASDHGTTFGGGPVTTAVAGKVWDIVSKPEFARRVKDLGEVLEEGLASIKAAHPGKVGELRGRGLLRGFEYLDGEVKDLLEALRARGILALRSGTNVVRIAPPLVITEKEIETGIALIKEALR